MFLKGVFGSAKMNTCKIQAGRHVVVPSSAGGQVRDDDAHVLSAFDNDPHLSDLLHLYKGNELVGNIILAARKVWYQGFVEKLGLPTSYLLTPLIEELARDMDVEMVGNLTRNFRYQEKYVAHQPQPYRDQDPLLSNDLAPELFCYLIHLLPLDGRPDLEKPRTELDIDGSSYLQVVIDKRACKHDGRREHL
jgi:hypothetical protein